MERLRNPPIMQISPFLARPHALGCNAMSQVPEKFMLFRHGYHWPNDNPGCPASLGRNASYIGCGTTFGGIKEKAPFPADGAFGARIGPLLGSKPQWTCYQHY